MFILSGEKNKKIQEIAQNYFIELLLIFGSRVEGQIHKESDYDVAYLSKKNLNLEEEAKLIIELFSIFSDENIDLVNLRNAPALLLYKIADKCQVLYELYPLKFYSLRAYAFKRYIEEAKPLMKNKFERLQLEINKL